MVVSLPSCISVAPSDEKGMDDEARLERDGKKTRKHTRAPTVTSSSGEASGGSRGKLPFSPIDCGGGGGGGGRRLQTSDRWRSVGLMGELAFPLFNLI